MEQGEEECGEGGGMGLGRGVGLVPADGGGVALQGGEEEREGTGGMGFGRGICESTVVGEDGVGAAEGLAGERGVGLGEQEGREGAVGGVFVDMMVAGCPGTGVKCGSAYGWTGAGIHCTSGGGISPMMLCACGPMKGGMAIGCCGALALKLRMPALPPRASWPTRKGADSRLPPEAFRCRGG